MSNPGPVLARITVSHLSFYRDALNSLLTRVPASPGPMRRRSTQPEIPAVNGHPDYVGTSNKPDSVLSGISTKVLTRLLSSLAGERALSSLQFPASPDKTQK